MESAEHHEEVLAISKIVDQVADEFLGDDSDWGPLETVLPMSWCDGFMWMYRVNQPLPWSIPRYTEEVLSGGEIHAITPSPTATSGVPLAAMMSLPS